MIGPAFRSAIFELACLPGRAAPAQEVLDGGPGANPINGLIYSIRTDA